MILDMSPPNGSGLLSGTSYWPIPLENIYGFSCFSYISMYFFLGKMTDSFVIVFNLFESYSILCSDFFKALLSFSLMKMWFSFDTLRFAFSFFKLFKSALDF